MSEGRQLKTTILSLETPRLLALM